MSSFSSTSTPKSFLSALNPFIPLPVLIAMISPTQVQDLGLGLVQLHKVHMGPLLKPVKVSPGDIPSLKHVNFITQLAVVCQLAESVLTPTVYVIDKAIK